MFSFLKVYALGRRTSGRRSEIRLFLSYELVRVSSFFLFYGWYVFIPSSSSASRFW